MSLLHTRFPALLVIDVQKFEDARGSFAEVFHVKRYREAGIRAEFVQDNFSRSVRGVLRGLHYQIEHPQGKLCCVLRGEVFDVAVDLRRRSPTCGRWHGIYLGETHRRQLYIPPGFAHGFCVLSDVADVLYKCTDFYSPEHERTLLWNDPTLAIPWPVTNPILSEKDAAGLRLQDAPFYEDMPVG